MSVGICVQIFSEGYVSYVLNFQCLILCINTVVVCREWLQWRWQQWERQWLKRRGRQLWRRLSGRHHARYPLAHCRGSRRRRGRGGRCRTSGERLLEAAVGSR